MANRKFLMISGSGDGLGLALRLKQEGNDISVWIRDIRTKQNYDGLIKKVAKWDEGLDKSTIVIFDSNGGGKTAERIKAKGNLVFAGSVFADQLELDRGIAFEFMREVGIKVPQTETFTNYKDAKAYVKERDVRLAYKPSGLSGAGMSYVSSDPDDMIDMLDYFESISEGPIEFELQDFVEGVAISTEGWFNGKEFMTPFNHTFERKQLMNDDIGPSGGCSGNVVWNLLAGTDLVVTEGLSKFAGILSEQRYIGPIDLNTIINDEGVWALEFTPRFGFDALPAFLETLDQSVGDLIEGMAGESYPKEIKVKEGYGAGIRITIPPAPTERFKPDPGLLIRGFTREDRSHLYFFDVMFDDKNKLVNTAAYGNIVTITGFGPTIEGSMHEVNKIIERVRIPNMQYRTDLTSRFRVDNSNLSQFLYEKKQEDKTDEGQLVES